MTRARKPNTTCTICNKDIYRSPQELSIYKNRYCSKICFRKSLNIPETIVCKSCNKSFRPLKRRTKFCSRSCTNISRRGMLYNNKTYGNQAKRRLIFLKELFDFKTCMVKGCKYNTTFDIHRLIPGKLGGQYIIGNMYAICPNHHAEVTRGLIKLIKINDSELEIELETKTLDC